ncbi:MAG TPA: ankyrin repeat domain-containing protein, partial [Longimicrobiales bacterium]|nr:ankyrin repeat domain-containing protein [Longimicrobiales bacterium]
MRPIILAVVVALLTHSAFAAVAVNDQRLAAAAERGDKAAITVLLSEGADVNQAQPDGSTALHWAAYRGDADLVKQLIGAGANVNAKN